MSLQKCTSCNNQFTKKEIRKSIWSSWTYQSITCTECKTEHYPTIASRLLFGILLALPLFIRGILTEYIEPFSYALFSIAWGFLILITLQHIIKYKQK